MHLVLMSVAHASSLSETFRNDRLEVADWTAAQESSEDETDEVEEESGS